MNVTLKDGSVLAVESGATFMEVAKSISEGLARNAVCAKWNGKLVDLSETVNGDGTLEIVTLRDEEGLDVYRHTCSHVMAQAIKTIFPTCKLAIGPTVEDGFYYDIDFVTPSPKRILKKLKPKHIRDFQQTYNLWQ